MFKKAAGSSAGYDALRHSITDDTLGKLYIFSGEESYLREHYLQKVQEVLLEAGMEDFNLHRLTGKEVTAKAISDAVDCLPMMAARTLVLVYDYDMFKAAEAERNALMAVFSDLPDYVCLIFVYDVVAYAPDARTKLAAAIKSCGTAVQFARQEQSDLISWVARRFRAEGHDCTAEQARYLIFLCGDLMHNLASEIGKISAFAKHKGIAREDIDAVAVPQLDAVVFALTDALTAGNFDKAATVLGDLLHMNEAPIKIMSVLGKQLRQLYSARLALEARRGAGFVADLWGMRSPYPAQKLTDAARRFDLNWCRAAVLGAAQTDLAMKSITGAQADKLLVDFLLKLATHPPKTGAA